MTELNGIAINSPNSHTFDEHNTPVNNRKLNNFIKKSLLLITTLAGVAIGIIAGTYLSFFIIFN